MGANGTIGQAIQDRIAGTHTIVAVGSGRSPQDSSPHTCDWRDPNSVERVVNDVAQSYGRIDCLINAAGIWSHGPLIENTAAAVKDGVETNLVGPMLMARAVIPIMAKAKAGLIVFMNSQAGLNTFANRSVYNAAMWGLTGFAKALQKEVAEHGIRVTSIHAAKTDSPFFAKAGYDMDLSDALSPSEIAQSVEFLLSLDSRTVIPDLGIKRLEYNY